MDTRIIPLESDASYLVTNETFEAAAYLVNKIPLFDCTWHENQAFYVFKRDETMNETEIHYLEGRLSGNLLEYARQYQLLIKRIRRKPNY